MEDRRLVERILAGEESAFAELVTRYQRQVYWIAYDVLLDSDEARDVAQEAFIRVHAAIESFDLTRDFLNWIYRITRNLAIDALRRRRRRAMPMDDLGQLGLSAAPSGESTVPFERPGAAPTSRAEARSAAEDLRHRVALVLDDLPVEYRLALTLREFHDMSPREIARVTDCTYPTARWRLHRARALFKKAWETRYGEPAPTSESSA